MTASASSRRDAPLGGALCTFRIGERSFGLDVSLVGEVVAIDAVTPVALAPPAVRGLFNLRGTPVALLELGAVLGLRLDAAARHAKNHVALVVREGDLVVGLVIDRMDAVVDAARGAFTEPATRDHPAVKGFFELEGEGGRVVTVLEPTVVLERLEGVRLLAGQEVRSDVAS